MKHIIFILFFGFATNAFANTTINVRGQGYFPDRLTAQGVCAYNGFRRAVGYSQWRQAGNKIEGLRSYDGRSFSRAKWRGGMALASAICTNRFVEDMDADIIEPEISEDFANTTINVQGEGGYYPDRLTANGVCVFKGYGRAVGFTQWRQAGDKIEGLRSTDGTAYFQRDTWRGGMALASVTCSNGGDPQVNVRGQSYFPDRLTAQGICVQHGYYRAFGYTQWRQAGDKIEGLRSYDGSAFFQTAVWRGGMALDVVNCE